MIVEKPEVLWLAEYAVEIRFKTSFSQELTLLLSRAKEWLEKHPPFGMEEVLLTYQCLTVFYNPVIVKKESNSKRGSAFEAMKAYLQDIPWMSFQEKKVFQLEEITVPVKYGSEDLELLTEKLRLSKPQIIEAHQACSYRVHMLGFLPGFPYMGTLPSNLQVTRKASPSLHIAAGSVAIAGKQTGIYSQKSPGGWYVLGKTDIILFDKNRKPASYFKTGDLIRFKGF